MEEQKAREPSRLFSSSEDTISGKRVSEKYKRSLLQIREAIYKGDLNQTRDGRWIYDINQDYHQFEEGSVRAGSHVDIFSDKRIKAQRAHAVAEIAVARHQKERKELPSEHPAGWYGIDLSTPPEEFNNEPAALKKILKEIAKLDFSEAEVKAWVTGDQPTPEPAGEIQGKPEPSKRADYVFQQTGRTWKVVYRGRESAGLRGKGFLFLHFLAQHPGKKFTALELKELKQEGIHGDVSGLNLHGKDEDQDDKDDIERLPPIAYSSETF